MATVLAAALVGATRRAWINCGAQMRLTSAVRSPAVRAVRGPQSAVRSSQFVSRVRSLVRVLHVHRTSHVSHVARCTRHLHISGILIAWNTLPDGIRGFSAQSQALPRKGHRGSREGMSDTKAIGCCGATRRCNAYSCPIDVIQVELRNAAEAHFCGNRRRITRTPSTRPVLRLLSGRVATGCARRPQAVCPRGRGRPGGREYLQDALKVAGMRTFACGNGPDAVSLARDLVPDLIVINYLRSDDSGEVVCRVLRDDGVTEPIPIIVVTDDPVRSVRSQPRRCRARQALSARPPQRRRALFVRHLSDTPTEARPAPNPQTPEPPSPELPEAPNYEPLKPRTPSSEPRTTNPELPNPEHRTPNSRTPGTPEPQPPIH